MGADERAVLLGSIADTIADYRAGFVQAPTPDHVDRWIRQFPDNVELPLLREIDHVLKQTYLNRQTVGAFLRSLVRYEPLTGLQPDGYWPSVRFLEIQGAGQSQREMLEMFGGALQDELGVSLEQCGGEPSSFLYLDDGIFSGNRLLSDLTAWIQADAPREARVDVICMALHLGGQWYAKERIETIARESGKLIELHWAAGVKIENRRSEMRVSDVLRPTALPDEFSSAEGRHLLEQELLVAGARIREMAPHLNEYQRPLGNWVLDTLGFGTMFVTFRNCPNSAPLALWVGDPWYPLFPRRINQ